MTSHTGFGCSRNAALLKSAGRLGQVNLTFRVFVRKYAECGGAWGPLLSRATATGAVGFWRTIRQVECRPYEAAMASLKAISCTSMSEYTDIPARGIVRPVV